MGEGMAMWFIATVPRVVRMLGSFMHKPSRRLARTSSSPWLAAVLIVSLTAVVAFGVAAQKTPPSGGTTSASRDPAIEKALLEQGFPPKIVETFASTRSRLVSSTGSRYHIVQEIPSLGLRREVRLAIHSDQRLDTSALAPLDTTQGYQIYPLRFEVTGFQGGYHLSRAFFLPHDSIDPAAREKLGIKRGISRLLLDLNPFPVVHAQQSGVLGVVVASVVTAGGGDTFPAAIPYDPGLADTIPPVSRPPTRTCRAWSAEDVTELRKLMESEWGKAYQKRESEFRQWLQGDVRLRDLLKHGETERDAVNRAIREQRARVERRAGAALAGLQAIAMFTGQVLDWFENSDAIRSAQDCYRNPTNRVAQTARTADPMHRQVGEDLSQAERDNNALTAARGVGTALDVAAAVVMPAEVGLALTIATPGHDAMMAETQRLHAMNAVNSVTPCKPRYFSATVSYTYSTRDRGESEFHGRTEILTGSVIEVLNGSVVGVLDSNSQIPERAGWGTYRNTESKATNDCGNVAETKGPVPMYLKGEFKELVEDECAASGQKRRVPVFSLHLNAEAEGLEYSYSGKGLEYEPYTATTRCVPVPAEKPKTAGAKVVCYFPDVKLLEGGSFFSDFEVRDDHSDPGHGESRTCRLDIKVLAAPPPASGPPPPPPRDIR
jgi:hypothetical protein